MMMVGWELLAGCEMATAASIQKSRAPAAGPALSRHAAGMAGDFMRAVKCCPYCDREYAPTDGLTVKRTPVGRKIEELIFPVTGWWSAIFATSLFIFMAFFEMPEDLDAGRGIGWFIMYVPLIPGGIMAIISWFFPHVRIYHCRNCGKTHEVLLKADLLPDHDTRPRT
jgi:hypothetical protein